MCKKLNRDKVEEHLYSIGADLVGFASVEEFDREGTLPQHHPKHFLPGAKAVIVAGLKVIDSVLDPITGKDDEYDETFTGYLRYYHYNMLDFLGGRIARFIERMGYDAYPVQPRYTDRENYTGVFANKHAAIAAGLGYFGKNKLIITPEFGPRVRFVSIITDLPLECGSPVDYGTEDLCEDCSLCIDNCPAKAITFDKQEGNVSKWDCREIMDQYHCGLCQAICPYGKKAANKRRNRN